MILDVTFEEKDASFDVDFGEVHQVSNKPGTIVTVGGVEQETFDADTKLDKVTTPQSDVRVYCVGLEGEQSTRKIRSDAQASSIPWRSTGGVVRVGTPKGNDDAVNLSYMNSALEEALKEAKSYADSNAITVDDVIAALPIYDGEVVAE